jgi:hypothetical protein
MIITQEWINIITPKHGRTSCCDEDLSNRFGGWNGYYDRHTGKKEIKSPRCVRCYLMDNIGIDTESLEFEISTEVFLTWRDKE